ncbi:undecaprenyldiphospho-muramoylpentapeptide beta-N-acetylglucosaminyltransferase [Fusobacterium nucleatum]|uniref:undecaprenyldiphospho-muramoylpentapeptide beta-N-acetylglucosaminyltransferase n=1 Tax=Fusobacterium nucleatum TaxID=851 RepID=UPI003CFD3FA0
MKKVMLTTGGTGGHIYPALAVADKLELKSIETVFVGSTERMEKDIVPESGHRFIGIDISVPKGWRNIIKYLKAIKIAYKIIKEEKPDAIVGFGNYISVPVIVAGILLRKKIYLQEQNVNIGFANKLFYKVAKMTFLAFDKTYDDIPIKAQNKFKVTGNPLRKGIENLKYHTEREKLGIKEDEKVLLITGGSLGAQEINNIVMKYWEKLCADKKLRIYWATGKNFEELKKVQKTKKEDDRIETYFNDMLNVMAAADLMVCRAGALTISEIIELEKPAIIIPYGSIKVGQYENAKALTDYKAAYVYTKYELDDAMKKVFEIIRNDEKLKKIRARLKPLKKPNAAEEIIASLDIWRN